VAPSGTGNLPYQLVKANPAMGSGAMTGVTFIQRVALKGGVAPAAACTTANKGERQIVKYQADYISGRPRKPRTPNPLPSGGYRQKAVGLRLRCAHHPAEAPPPAQRAPNSWRF